MVSEQLLSRIFLLHPHGTACFTNTMVTRYASRLRLYAEFLPNISQIAVYVTLADLPNSSETQSILEIVPSRDELLLSVGDQKRSLRLPARVAPSAPSYFPLQPGSASNIDQREFSFRLQVDEGSQCFPSRDASTPQIPWSAKHMSAETQIKCRACGNILLEPQGGNRMVWKDLPSANWAELMDIWHCHKPDSHEDGDHKDKITHNGPMSTHNESAASKGYGAGNHTVCQADTVLVDVMNFYVTETNAVGVESMLHGLVSDTAAQD
ncbi:uncharacterized protein CIMG_10920 [Coccidioides immitis RS]|uniref:Ubiquitin-conjugating enzyme E2C-binding protein n=1 Tax=Coccidioides immitis (strain RS) TaxID=246410 RepID=A0A0D8JRW6_COCIM|nr:uncharacterized protein CIMG_10920 [Coccidioides immitis RS]KJF60032.1 hypothetical protein CIMG_10920 [Coccidioides immitis RS]